MTPATICFPFVGNLVGGSHVSATRLIAHLDRSRFRPLVALQHGSGAIADLLGQSQVEHQPAPATPELEHGRPLSAAGAIGLAASLPRLVSFLRAHRCAIVHCNDGRTLATWALAARLAGARLLWHHRGSPRAAGLRLLAPCLADRVVAVSKFAAPSPGLYSAARRTRVIHSPFDTERRVDRVEARRELVRLVPGSTSATRFVAFSGALIDRKRPLLFVDAIAALRRIAPALDLQGVVFGEALDGMGDRVAARAGECGVEGHLSLLGYRTPGPVWLAACDLLLVPAVDEPFGRTLIEAMLVRTPVVATASGGNVEAVRDGETGLLVPPEDAEALAKACLRLLSDSSLATAIAAQAEAEARQRFGEAAHAAEIMKLYDEMLRQRATAPVPTIASQCVSR